MNTPFRLLLSITCSLNLVGIATAQAPTSAPGSGTKPAPAQPQPRRVIPVADRVFEVVSIKRNVAGNSPGVIGGTSTRLSIANMPLRNLIAWAYRVDPFQVIEGPSWINEQHFDVLGIPKAGAGWDDEMPDMLQKALIERFSMIVVTEERSFPVYVLTPARSDARLGPALRKSTVDCTKKVSNLPSCWLNNGASSVEAVGRDWAQIALARTLRRTIREMVLDETRLTGKFDMKFEWTPGLSLSGQAGDGISVFTALREQLGLQLVRESRPVDFVVIKSIGPLIED
jgi:uncharacterized protein (TIGR03435 family)